jgi:HEAT repeat protein
MIAHLSTLVLLLAPLDPARTPPPPLQEEAAQVADERPEVEALLDELKTHVKEKGEKDPEAIGVLDKLVTEFPGSGPKDRAAIVAAVEDCLDVKRTKELEEGVPDDRLYQAAAVALGTMGPESVKPLIGLIGDKAHRKNMRLQQALALSLGKTKSPDALKTLLGLMKHKDAPMQAAGADALANYHDAPLDTRKEIFEELLKTMMDQRARTDNVTDQEAQERWNVISGPILQTLQKLTGHAETDPVQWQSWWNDNKKKDWDEKAG